MNIMGDMRFLWDFILKIKCVLILLLSFYGKYGKKTKKKKKRATEIDNENNIWFLSQ